MEMNPNSQAIRLMRLLAENINPHLLKKIAEMSSSPAIVFGELAKAKDGLTPKELAALCDVVPSRITAVLDHLERDGLVERYQKEGDRLHIFVRLTPKGKDFANERVEKTMRWFEDLVGALGEEKTETFIECLSTANQMKEKEGCCYVAS